MKYEDFETLINSLIEQHKKINAAYKIGIDLYEFVEETSKSISLLIKQIMDQEGEEWFSWYLYERDGISGNPRLDLNAWDENGKEICYDIKSLYELLIKGNHFKITNNNAKEA